MGAGGFPEGRAAIDGNPHGQASGPADGPTDRQAVERARTGDHRAFQVLVERYQGRAFRLALRVLRDEEQARDAVQEAFLKLYTRLRRFEGRSSFYTWFYRLVMNQCLDMRRREHPERRLDLGEAQSVEQLLESRRETPEASWERAHEQGPAEHLEAGELRRAVARAVDELPDGARETLVLREVEGLSYAEISEVLQIPKGTVMSRLHYARRRVQGILEQGGVLESEPSVPEENHLGEPAGVRR